MHVAPVAHDVAPMSTIPGTPNATCTFHRSHVHKRLTDIFVTIYPLALRCSNFCADRGLDTVL